MFHKFNLIVGIFAVLMFTYAQQEGWNLFDNVANSGRGGSGSSHSYHK